MGPSINTIFTPFEVAYVMESGKLSCVKVITQSPRTNLLCVLLPTFEERCGFIYSDSGQTERLISLRPERHNCFQSPFDFM